MKANNHKRIQTYRTRTLSTVLERRDEKSIRTYANKSSYRTVFIGEHEMNSQRDVINRNIEGLRKMFGNL